MSNTARALLWLALLWLALFSGLSTLAACLPPPEPARGLPPPPAQSHRRCPGPRPRCLSGEECAHDNERDCIVCRCRRGYRQDDQRRDPRWIYGETDD